jgi:hypothetical protein
MINRAYESKIERNPAKIYWTPVIGAIKSLRELPLEEEGSNAKRLNWLQSSAVVLNCVYHIGAGIAFASLAYQVCKPGIELLLK